MDGSWPDCKARHVLHKLNVNVSSFEVVQLLDEVLAFVDPCIVVGLILDSCALLLDRRQARDAVWL